MTWVEKLRAKLKEKGLPEYLAGVFRGSSDEDISSIVESFGEVKPDAPEFDSVLSTAIQKSLDGIVDSRIHKAVSTNESKLREKYNFVDKKAADGMKKDNEKTDPTSEVDELRKMISTLGQQVTTLLERETKEKLVGSFLSKAKDEKKLPEQWDKKYTQLTEQGLQVYDGDVLKMLLRYAGTTTNFCLPGLTATSGSGLKYLYINPTTGYVSRAT